MSHADFSALKKWFAENGGYLHPAVSRRFADGMFGLTTSQPLKKSEVIVEVPPSLHLTLPQLLEEVGLGDRSRFYSWIAQLPKLEDFRAYHPFFASEQELLQLHQLAPRITRSLQNFRDRIDEFHHSTGDRFEFAQVVWAHLVYLTRAFEGGDLVPVADMFNHHAVRGRGLIDNRLLKTGCDLDIGDEVFISYGRHFDSLELWLHFGFIDRAAQSSVIGCSGIKSEAAGVTFDQTCYIDDAGPSQRLVEVCRDRKTLQSLGRSLLQELGSCGPAASPLVEQAQRLIEERRRLAQNLC